jgi:hypothetical protein
MSQFSFANKQASFEVPSGRMVVADPAYLTHENLAVVIDNAKPGRWWAVMARESDCGPYVSSVVVFHDSESELDGAADRELMRTVGVDSGHVCLVDAGSIDCYEIAGLAPGLRIDPCGLMVPSGFGDGIYACCVRERAGQAVLVRIVFIDTEGDQ